MPTWCSPPTPAASRRAGGSGAVAGAEPEPRLVAEARGAADALAVRLRHHDPSSTPCGPQGRQRCAGVFEHSKPLGWRRSAARPWTGFGPTSGLGRGADPNGRDHSRPHGEEVPLATAVGLLAPALTARSRARGARRLELIAPWIEQKDGAEWSAGVDGRRPGGLCHLSRR